MKKIGRQMRMIDFLMIILISIKIGAFYITTDMTGIRGLTALMTLLFLILIVIAFGLSSRKGIVVIFGITYTLISVLMFADSMYYAYFNQLPSILQLAQVDKMIVVDADTFSVVLPLMNILILIDIPFVIWYFYKLNRRIGTLRYVEARRNVRMLLIALSIFIIIGVANPLNVDTFRIINQSELVSYHLRDIYENVIATEGEYIKSDEDLRLLFEDLYSENTIITPGYEKLKGIGKDYNLIVIQVESMQNFPIGRSFEGIELTPNLNRFIEKDTLYFNHYYQTIGRGNTSDAEFTSNNGLYPVINGESYGLYEENKYHGLPWLLKEKGYKSSVYHGFIGEFWNREKAYIHQGFDDYISLEDLEMTEKIAFGLSDVALFDQVFEKLLENDESGQEPFHSFIITLSCHYPYRMPMEFQIDGGNEQREDSLFLNYLGGIRYSDYALGMFLDKLENSEFKDNTIIAIYGDHYGLNAKEKDNYEQMSDYLGRAYDYDQMLNIPLLIHIPNLSDIEIPSTIIEKVGGQVDFLPTIAYLMDLDVDERTMGNNLFLDKPGYVASITYMLKGSFIKDGIIYEACSTEVFEQGRAWYLDSGEVIEDFDFLYNDYVNACRIVEGSKYILDYDVFSIQ